MGYHGRRDGFERAACCCSLWASFVATAVGAGARDLCADWVNGGSFVLKGFKIPSRNKCGPVQGFDPVSGNFMITGTACTTVAGDRMTLQYISQTRITMPSYLESAMCD